jgi:hypothetical protein
MVCIAQFLYRISFCRFYEKVVCRSGIYVGFDADGVAADVAQ